LNIFIGDQFIRSYI